MAECERSFGFALFLRYGRRLYPTAVGRFAVECAQKILDEQRRMLLTMKAVMGRSRRQIRLATAPNRGAIIYSKIYRPFSRRYPDVALSLTELLAIDQPAAIARGQIDLALGAGPASPGTAAGRRIGRTHSASLRRTWITPEERPKRDARYVRATYSAAMTAPWVRARVVVF